MSYQTFAITLRPRGGITPADQKTFDTWMEKKCMYYFAAKEKRDTDGEHIHAGVAMDKEWKMSNMRLTLKRLFPTWEDDCVKHGIKCSVWYSMDWYDEYAQKEDDDNVYLVHMPQDKELVPFPPKDDRQLARPVSIWYHNLEARWLEQDPQPLPTPHNIRRFVRTLMFVDRSIEVIADTRVFNQRCKALERYICKDVESDDEVEMGVCESCRKRKHPSEFCS